MKQEDRTLSLVERDKQVVWHPDTQMQTAPPPVPIVAGKGSLLIDENGVEYVDGISSWWVNIHGHGHPYIAQKIAAQAAQLEHCIFAGLTHPPAVELAERLLRILPAGQSKIFFSDNGSTAVEVALKMAIQYWFNQGIQKNKILAFRNGYHGDTFGAMSVSSRSVFTRAFEEYLFEVDYIDIPVTDGTGKGIFNSPDECTGELPGDAYYDEVRQKLQSGEYAAFIFEPLILGAGGMLMYAPEALERLIQICRQEDVLIITDEVMTGFGRTGKRFAMEYLSSSPDIICLSKGLTGGTMALGITSCQQKVYDAFLSNDKLKTFLHGHSFTANPIACAASLASLDLFLDPSCEENIRRIISRQAAFREQIKDHPVIKNARQTGTIMAFEIITEEADSYMNNIRDFLSAYFLKNHIILRPLGNTIYILPPYCTTNEQLQQIHDAISSVLDEIQKRGVAKVS
jgi:adenosylmethionine-8-amino-7-oxononanoate aminotransferase